MSLDEIDKSQGWIDYKRGLIFIVDFERVNK
jgi:hypothetical protein